MGSNKKQTDKEGNRKPVATITMILVACGVTLIGVASGLEPDVILIRCTISGICAGILTTLITSVLSTMTDESGN